MYKVTKITHYRNEALGFEEPKTEVFEFPTKEEALVFFEDESSYGFFDWVEEQDDSLVVVWDDEGECVNVMLEKWDGFEEDIKVVCKVDGTEEEFGTIREAYEFACKDEGVLPKDKISFFQESDDVDGNYRSMYFNLKGLKHDFEYHVLYRDWLDDKRKELWSKKNLEERKKQVDEDTVTEEEMPF